MNQESASSSGFTSLPHHASKSIPLEVQRQATEGVKEWTEVLFLQEFLDVLQWVFVLVLAQLEEHC
jgi:hypothetical protein